MLVVVNTFTKAPVYHEAGVALLFVDRGVAVRHAYELEHAYRSRWENDTELRERFRWAVREATEDERVAGLRQGAIQERPEQYDIFTTGQERW